MASPLPPRGLFQNLLSQMFWCNLTAVQLPGQFVIRPTPTLPLRIWACMGLAATVVLSFAAFFYQVSRELRVSITIASIGLGYLLIFTAVTSTFQFRRFRAGPVLTLDVRTRTCRITRAGQEPLALSLLEVQVVSGGSRYYEIPGGKELIHYTAILVVGRTAMNGAIVLIQAARDDSILAPLPRIGRALADAAGVPFRHDRVPTPMTDLASDEARRPAA